MHHAHATADYNVSYGRGRDIYDVRGRVAHESLFNPANGSFRGPSSQQGYSPFTTWTRGLAWAILGFAEQLEFLATLSMRMLEPGADARDRPDARRRPRDLRLLHRDVAAADGVPYWDSGAPGLAALGDWGSRPADPFNDHEPVDSSAAAIAAQGLLRFARVPARSAASDGDALRAGGAPRARHAVRSRWTIPRARPDHQGLLLHSIYHRPNGWDYVPDGAKIPRGESSMWGDYHAREAAVLRAATGRRRPYLTFFGGNARCRLIRTSHDGGDHGRSRWSPAAREASASASRAPSRARAGISRCAALRAEARRRCDRDLRDRRRRGRTTSRPTSRARPIGHDSWTAVGERYGAIDALVNNAGRAPRVRADLLDATEDSFEEVLRTNLQGPYFLTQAVAREHGRAAARGRRSRRRSSSSRRCRRRWRRPIAANTASARRDSRWRRSCSRSASPRTASRSTRCARASSPPT